MSANPQHDSTQVEEGGRPNLGLFLPDAEENTGATTPAPAPTTKPTSSSTPPPKTAPTTRPQSPRRTRRDVKRAHKAAAKAANRARNETTKSPRVSGVPARKIIIRTILVVVGFGLLYVWYRQGGGTSRIVSIGLAAVIVIGLLSSKYLAKRRANKGDTSGFIDRLPAWVTAGKPIGKGPRRLLWLVYVHLGLYKARWIPQPRPHGLHLRRIIEWRRYIVEQRQHSMAIVTVHTTKGGAAKTTVSTWFAAILMWIIKLVVHVFDTDNGKGKVAKRFGIEPDQTMSSQEVVREVVHYNWGPTYQDLVQRVRADLDTGVMVFHCRAGESIESGDVIETLTRVATTCHTLVVDTAPGFDRTATDGVMRLGTVHILTGRFPSEEDMDDIGQTLKHEPYHLSERLDQVIIVVSDVNWLHFNTRTQYELAEINGVDPERIVLIPHIRHLARTRNVIINVLSPKALYAWVRLVRVQTAVAVAYNRNHPARTLPGEVTNTTEQHHPEQHTSAQATSDCDPAGRK